MRFAKTNEVNMKRRDFSAVVGVGTLGLLNQSDAWAQTYGKEYEKVDPAVPTNLAAGKIQVIEFFGYWCVHCYSFEPALEAWISKAPANVSFTRVHVAFRPKHKTLQHLFIALETSGQLSKWHAKVFEGIFIKQMKIETDADVAEFMKANGASAAEATKMMELVSSSQVSTKATQAEQLAKDYKLDGIPTLVIGGKFKTSPSLAGGEAQAIKVLESLVAKVSASK
jgi:thiol:disulfide interchange protein DsbA